MGFWGVARQRINLAFLTALTIFSWLPGAHVIAAETSAGSSSLKEIKDYNAAARELNKNDAFNIRLALKKAILADSPGDEFRWRNTHTQHRGSITLLEFIEPRSDGTACVSFFHTYYPDNSAPRKSTHKICRDYAGAWESVETQIAASIPKSTASVEPKAPSRLQQSIDSIQKYTDEARELNKTDAFNIRTALRRAISADDPGDEFHWNNSHTGHRGTITLTSFIEPRAGDKECVDFVHVYYAGRSTPYKAADSVCRDHEGRWQLGQIQHTAAAAPE